MTKRRERFLFSKRKSLRDSLDFDYLEKLSPEERAWLDEFSREYYHGNPPREGALHPQERRKELYAANNARNRDMWNQWDRLPLDAGAYERAMEQSLTGQNKKTDDEGDGGKNQ
jgi:hypothetical protein